MQFSYPAIYRRCMIVLHVSNPMSRSNLWVAVQFGYLFRSFHLCFVHRTRSMCSLPTVTISVTRSNTSSCFTSYRCSQCSYWTCTFARPILDQLALAAVTCLGAGGVGGVGGVGDAAPVCRGEIDAIGFWGLMVLCLWCLSYIAHMALQIHWETGLGTCLWNLEYVRVRTKSSIGLPGRCLSIVMTQDRSYFFWYKCAQKYPKM